MGTVHYLSRAHSDTRNQQKERGGLSTVYIATYSDAKDKREGAQDDSVPVALACLHPTHPPNQEMPTAVQNNKKKELGITVN